MSEKEILKKKNSSTIMYLVDSFYNKKDCEYIDLITNDLNKFTKKIKLNK